MKTVVDKSVRSGFELSDKDFAADLEWDARMHKVVNYARDVLVPGSSIHNKLYKMVIYEVGGLFKPHRDTQRSEDHFGTLVVILPSKCKGGELILRHGNKEETFFVPSRKSKQCTFVAFFADIEHEVLPVIEGRKICLIYNLYRTSSSKVIKTPKAYPSKIVLPIVAEIEELKIKLLEMMPLEETKDSEDEEDEVPEFIGYICNYAYAGSLTFDKLKGKDMAFYQLFVKTNPNIRLAELSIRLYGNSEMDDARNFRSFHNFDRYCIEIDEIRDDTARLLFLYIFLFA